eukprot:7379860-Alexandrium_andersonii.AAC.1
MQGQVSSRPFRRLCNARLQMCGRTSSGHWVSPAASTRTTRAIRFCKGTRSLALLRMRIH